MSIESKVSNNLAAFIQDGPRMSTRYQTYVLARDRDKKMVLVGGLGCVGVGRMWMAESSCANMNPTEMETAQECSYQGETLDAVDNAVNESEMLKLTNIDVGDGPECDCFMCETDREEVRRFGCLYP